MTGTTAGQELWGFIPPEGALRQVQAFARQQPDHPAVHHAVDLTTPQARDCLMDGPLGVYQKVDTTGTTTKAYLFAGMRRRGRLIDALDVTTPASPKFLGMRTAASTGSSVLGQTWSEPKVALSKGWGNPLIIMGAGYDAAAEDVDRPGTTTMGDAVLSLDATDGTLLRSFATDPGVPADVTLMDVDVDGKIDRAYAVDVGGNICRIDVETDTRAAEADWPSSKRADLQSGAKSSRKFFHPPDVVQAPTFVAVMAGTGDREKSLEQVTEDALFTVYDVNMGHKPATTPRAITTATMGEVGATATGTVDGC